MASMSGVNAPHEVSLLIDFRPVWDAYVRLWDGDIPLDNQRPNAHWQGRIEVVDISTRHAVLTPYLCDFDAYFWLCHVLDSHKRCRVAPKQPSQSGFSITGIQCLQLTGSSLEIWHAISIFNHDKCVRPADPWLWI